MAGCRPWHTDPISFCGIATCCGNTVCAQMIQHPGTFENQLFKYKALLHFNCGHSECDFIAKNEIKAQQLSEWFVPELPTFVLLNSGNWRLNNWRIQGRLDYYHIKCLKSAVYLVWTWLSQIKLGFSCGKTLLRVFKATAPISKQRCPFKVWTIVSLT